MKNVCDRCEKGSPIVQSRAVLCAPRRLGFKTSTRMVMENPPSTPVSCENAVAVARKFSAPVFSVLAEGVCAKLSSVSVRSVSHSHSLTR